MKKEISLVSSRSNEGECSVGAVLSESLLCAHVCFSPLERRPNIAKLRGGGLAAGSLPSRHRAPAQAQIREPFPSALTRPGLLRECTMTRAMRITALYVPLRAI